ncbi:MAG: hypothetical protein IJP01_06290, partial [Oscillospiraceae bacterium]|nr:hypothetical protein [Oscillospiraceae bacterium]
MQQYKNCHEQGKWPWYSVLVQPRYVAYFADETNRFCADEPLFCEFAQVVSGIVAANAVLEIEPAPQLSDKMKMYGEMMCKSAVSLAAYRHTLATVPQEYGFFAKIIKGVRDKGESLYGSALSALTDGALALSILYPFFERMGGSFA